MKAFFVILACFLICGISWNCEYDAPVEEACNCEVDGSVVCQKGYRCLYDQGSDAKFCAQNSCSDSNNPLEHSCFCGNDLCEIGSVCFNGVCTEPSVTIPTTILETNSSSFPEGSPEKEENTTKEIVKTVLKAFLVGMTVAVPLSFGLCLL